MKDEAKTIALACIVFLALFGIYRCVNELRHHPEARLEMRDFLSRAQLGDTKAQVRQKFKAGAYKVLRLLDSPDDQWAVNTPFEIGAGNWLLYLEFGQDKVRALRLRTGDSPSQKPRDAPPDKIAPGWPQKFPRS